MKCDQYKIGIVGCGKVGLTAAYALVLKGLADELVLLSRNQEKLSGEALDLEHGLPFLTHTKIRATNNYQDLQASDLVIVTAGAAQKPGETRLDLTTKNLRLIEEIIPSIVRYAPGAVILIVSNPVDILTYRAYQIAGLPKGQIIGSGTALDTARFRFHLSEVLHVNPKSIHAYILGEHGDTSFPALSSASVGGQNLLSYPGLSETKIARIYQKTREAAYDIIAAKGATYYGIATVILNLAQAILRDEKIITPISVPLHQYFGHSGIALSVPAVLGRRGAEQILNIKLSWEEKKLLAKSVNTLKQYLP